MSDIPASFVLITGGSVNTIVITVTQAMIAAGTAPTATSAPRFTYSTIPSNTSNVIDYFPDYDIK